MKRRRIGLMGGTFDPIHLGHLVAAERAAEAEGLDEVRFMPTFLPPHKDAHQGALAKERREMTELAIEGNPLFRLEPMELERGGVSYSVDTAAELREREPDCDWFWIIGGDMVLYLTEWHEIERLATLVSFIGLTRPGFPVDPSSIPDFLKPKVRLAEMPVLDISSTDIRERLRHGRTIRYLVPEPVRRYIERKGLYADAEAHEH